MEPVRMRAVTADLQPPSAIEEARALRREAVVLRAEHREAVQGMIDAARQAKARFIRILPNG